MSNFDTLDAIDRGATLGVLSAADEVLATKQLAERQTEALNEIRARHYPSRETREGQSPWCMECGLTVPCPTIRIIERAGA